MSEEPSATAPAITDGAPDAPATHSSHWGAYLVKACALIGLLYLLGHFAGSLPPWAIAFVWALVSVASAVGLTYHRVVRKTLKQHEYSEKGHLARLNNGRLLCLLISFVGSAWCMAGLMVEVPTWELPEWGLAAAAVPLYLVVSLAAQRLLRKEYEPAFRASKVALGSGVAVAALLTVVYGILSLAQPVETYGSASEAFLAVRQPFEGSPSALASEAGMLSALVEGFATYGASRAAEASLGVYAVWKIVLIAAAFCGVASLLGLCSLPGAELKRVFLPLEAASSSTGAQKVVKRNVAMVVLLPAVLVGGFLWADAAVARATQAEEYTAVQRFVRDQVDLAVYVLDGSYYDYQAVQELLKKTQAEAAALAADAEATLVPLVNASFDARLANVDAYLDWYYSLLADYERLIHLVTGSVEDFVTEQFVANIEAGVDDSAFESQLQAYCDRVGELEDALTAGLAACELTGIPEWLPVVKDDISIDFLEQPLEPTQQIMGAGTRLLTSAGTGALAGAGVGMVAKRLVERAVEKPFFKMVVDQITKRIGSKAVAGAIGGVVGSAGGPVGVAVGVATGGAVSVGVDYGLLKVDELLNRDAYREEVVQTIEDARAETLALIQQT